MPSAEVATFDPIRLAPGPAQRPEHLLYPVELYIRMERSNLLGSHPRLLLEVFKQNVSEIQAYTPAQSFRMRISVSVMASCRSKISFSSMRYARA